MMRRITCAVFALAVTGCSTVSDVSSSSTSSSTSLPGAIETSVVPITTGTNSAEIESLRSVGLRPIGDYTKSLLLEIPFEDATETAAWYVTPQTPLTHHKISDELVHGGSYSFKAWVTGANNENIEPDGPNHRGYPTIQLDEGPRACLTPCLLSLWVWADIPTVAGEWYQIATVSPSADDSWFPAQVVNVGSEGWLHVMHVPSYGKREITFQREDLLFPTKQWVKVEIVLKYSAEGGALAVFQNDELVNVSRIDPTVGPNGGLLNQMHFGMYGPPTLSSGVIFNDDVKIFELRD
jgi:hypothetical protein